MSSAYFPVLIDPADSQCVGAVGGSDTPLVYRNALYSFQRLDSNPTPADPLANNCNVFASADHGQTWAALDGLNAPTSDVLVAGSHLAGNQVGFAFDGKHTVICLFQTAGALALQNFDLDTGIWGAAYGVAGAPAPGPLTGRINVLMRVRPNGTLFVVLQGSAPLSASGYSYDFLAAAWSGPFDLLVNIAALPNYNGNITALSTGCTSAMDASGVIHWFINLTSSNNAPTVWDNRCFYQQILVDGSLGAFFDFPGQDAVNQALLRPLNGGGPMGTPVIVGANIVLPVTAAIPFHASLPYPTLYLGTPVGAPVWSLLAGIGGIDPAVQGGGTNPTADFSLCPGTMIAGEADGEQITFVWSVSDPTDTVPLARLRISTTLDLANPAAGWSASSLFDMTTNPVPAGFYPLLGQLLVIPTLRLYGGDEVLVTVDALDPATSVETRFWMGNFRPIAIPGLKILLRGIKRRPCGPVESASPWRPSSTHVPRRGLVV